MTPLQPPGLAELRAARERVAPYIRPIPLVRLWVDGSTEIWLKLENLQPIGSFKLRGAASALAAAEPATLAQGVWTASAGNMAQGVAWIARERGVPCTAVVPDHAPRAKLDAVAALGARIDAVPFERWWAIVQGEHDPGLPGLFVHPVCDPAVLAGNGTIGLEIHEDLPHADAVVVPFGGGGLGCGIASALRVVGARAKVFASEVETAAPLGPALRAGHPVTVEYHPTFVDGIGSTRVLDPMFPLAQALLAGSQPVSVAEIEAAIRLLVQRAHVVSEGAGASSVAAATSGRIPGAKIVCVVSGGNLNPTELARILRG